MIELMNIWLLPIDPIWVMYQFMLVSQGKTLMSCALKKSREVHSYHDEAGINRAAPDHGAARVTSSVANMSLFT